MGYTVSSRAITRVFNQLQQMVKAETNLEWVTDNPREFAYRLREAISVAQDRAKKGDGEPYESFGRLKAKYLFRERNGKVIAELRDVIPQMNLKSDFAVMTEVNASDAMSIVGVMIKNRGKVIAFPAFEGEESELVLVRNWAAKNDYNVIVHDSVLKLEPIT
jgi:hypothetical protein